jgi:nucleoside-triphosphatase THEP1
MASGLRICGTVQVSSERGDGQSCDMDVVVLPDGPVIRISQARGREARGCRLDPRALEDAVGLVMTRFGQGADGLIVNKFGKHEAEGRGFRDLIGEALAQGVPVLVGLNALNRDAFMEFADGLAEALPASEPALVEWFREGRVPAAGEV